jgi:hypothetical protein
LAKSNEAAGCPVASLFTTWRKYVPVAREFGKLQTIMLSEKLRTVSGIPFKPTVGITMPKLDPVIVSCAGLTL